MLLIGRAIRHGNDYATIILLDRRFTENRIKRKLPRWIGDGIVASESFGKCVGEVARFFKKWRHQP